MAQTVVGIFDSGSDARNAVERLRSNGFMLEDVDMSSRDTQEDEEGFGDRVSRFFKNLFGNEDESSRYSNVARNSAVVTVRAETEELAEQAADILDDCGAINVDERYQSGVASGSAKHTLDTQATTDLDESRDRNLTTDTTSRDRSTSIPIIEEELHVGKREVERGSVRVRSRIIERPAEESIRLREEHIRVERTPADRAATERDLNTFREGEIEMRQHAEVPVINKEVRVVEEVNLNKEVTERDEVVRDTVRRTEVEIDETDNDRRARRADSDDDLL